MSPRTRRRSPLPSDVYLTVPCPRCDADACAYVVRGRLESIECVHGCPPQYSEAEWATVTQVAEEMAERERGEEDGREVDDER